ncbi:MAG: hypothetical protein ACI85N_000956 [Gammaproteobacteria bacterium]
MVLGYILIEDINKVLCFWFGTETDQKEIIRQQSGLWWGKDANTDLEIKERFGALYQLAINDELCDWLNNIKGAQALIIILDQFSRVINRDSPDAFSQDSKALNFALEGIGKGYDSSLSFIERVFYYMPLEHSENMGNQSQCVELFQKLLFEVPEDMKEEFQRYLQFAGKHKEIIERFHRFPHRNRVLNRISSAEELEFLIQPGSSF